MIRVRKLKREVQREEREKEDEKMNEFTTREVCTDCKIYIFYFFQKLKKKYLIISDKRIILF